MDKITSDLQKKHLIETADQKEFEKEMDFFRQDTEQLFDKINMTIEMIREINKSDFYTFDMSEYIKQEVQEIFDIELKE